MSASEATHRCFVPAVYGAIHALVDASTVATLFGFIGLHDIDLGGAFALVAGYDLLAFATQAIWGRSSTAIACRRSSR